MSILYFPSNNAQTLKAMLVAITSAVLFTFTIAFTADIHGATASQKKLPPELKRLILQERYEELLPKLTQLAGQQNREAAYKLAQLYLNGHGVAKNQNKAIHWLQQAGKNGHIKALYKLGLIYKQRSDKNQQEIKKAIHYFELAASHNHSMAKEQLALLAAGSNTEGGSELQQSLSLIQAAKQGRVAKVRQLVQGGVHINALNKSGNNALIAAILNNQTNVIKILLNAGADSDAKNSKGESALHIAIKTKQKKAAQLLLKNGTKVDILDRSKNTPLIYAVLTNEYQLAELLLKHGANATLVNDFKQSPFTMAKSKNQKEMIRLLETYGAQASNTQVEADIKRKLAGYKTIRVAKNSTQRKWSDLMMAAWYGDTEVAVYLLKRSADLTVTDDKGNSALALAILRGNESVAKKTIGKLVTSKGNIPELRAALKLAAQRGDEKVVQHILSVGVRPDYTIPLRETTLAKAINNNHEEIAIQLAQDNLFPKSGTALGWLLVLASKANMVNLAEKLVAQPVDISATDKQGRSALRYAVDNSNAKLVSLLVRGGANTNQMDQDQHSPFTRAILAKNEHIAKILFENGGDIHSQTSSGNTPLMLAISLGNHKLANLLIEKGADVTHRNRFSLTPLMLAAKHGRLKIITSLIKKGAKPYRQSKEGKNSYDYAQGNRDITKLLD